MTVTRGASGILHITIGQDNEPPASPARQIQRAVNQLATGLDLIARAYGGREMRDHEPMAERIVLDIEQTQALHHALIDYQHAVRDRGPGLTPTALPLTFSRPALPACPACDRTPGAVNVKDCRMTLYTLVDFTPCGHGFRIPDDTMQRLARLDRP